MRQEDELDALRDSLYRVEHLAQLLTLAVALIFFTLVSWAFIDELESRGII